MTVVCEQPQGGGKAILFPPNALKKKGEVIEARSNSGTRFLMKANLFYSYKVFIRYWIS